MINASFHMMCSFLHQTSNALTHTLVLLGGKTPTFKQIIYLERGSQWLRHVTDLGVSHLVVPKSRMASSTLERYDPRKQEALIEQSWLAQTKTSDQLFVTTFPVASDFAGPLGFTSRLKRIHGGRLQAHTHLRCPKWWKLTLFEVRD